MDLKLQLESIKTENGKNGRLLACFFAHFGYLAKVPVIKNRDLLTTKRSPFRGAFIGIVISGRTTVVVADAAQSASTIAAVVFFVFGWVDGYDGQNEFVATGFYKIHHLFMIGTLDVDDE
uniref:Uncharacterized protein n=1 Tax=Romanomermis culicivorax TaxID=13658 RepID=A0A915L3X9_ROMCU